MALSLCLGTALSPDLVHAQSAAGVQQPTTIRGWLESFMASDPSHFNDRMWDLIRANPTLQQRIIDDAIMLTFERQIALNPATTQEALAQYVKTYPHMQAKLQAYADAHPAALKAAEVQPTKTVEMASTVPDMNFFDQVDYSVPLLVGGGLLGVAGVVTAVALASDGNSNNRGGGSVGSSSSGSSPEYNAQYGLGSISAASAYDRGGNGEGIIVAVIDSGLDTTHPEFSGRIADAGGYDFINGTSSVTDTDGSYSHGTHVAGVIAANRDSNGMHGVAWNAKILPVAAIGSGAPSTAVVDAVNYASAQGAHVMNASYGPSFAATQIFESYGAQLLTSSARAQADAYMDAAANGMVLVFAAGNEYDPDLTPVTAANPTGGGFLPFVRPANANLSLGTSGAYRAYNDDTTVTVMSSTDYSALEPMTLAVVAVDQNNTIASFSNRCGVTKDWCLAAPGVDVYSTEAGGGYSALSGTSFSAPHVVGAIAVLRQLFPELTPQEVVQILKESATDLGDPGVDDVYGNGLVNLEAASRPLSGTSVALGTTTSGPLASLSASNLGFGSAFGAMAANALAGQELGMLDGYRRNYVVPLSNYVKPKISAYDSEMAMQRFAQPEYRPSYHLGDDISLSFSLKAARDENLVVAEPKEAKQGPELASFTIEKGLTEGATTALRRNDVQSVGLLFRPEDRDRLAAHVGQSGTSNPYLGFVGDGYAQSVTVDLSDKARMRLTSALGKPQDDTDQRNLASMAEVSADIARDVTAAVSLGFLQEENRVLGMHGSGAFALGEGTSTVFAGAGANARLAEGLEFRGMAWLGITDPQTSSLSLIRDMSQITTSAFSADLVQTSLFRREDKLTLGIAQPLRVESGTMGLSLPVYRLRNGSVVRNDFAQSLAPTGRELDLEMNYAWSLDHNLGDLAFGAMWRKDAGHVAGEQEGIGLARYSRDF